MLSSTYRAIAGACPTRLQLFSPGVHGEQFSDILRIQGSTELMIAHMLEVTYGTKAGVIMNYDSCAGVFREGACERFKLGDTAETIVKGNMDGTLDELRAALAGLMSASNAELEGVVSTGVYNGSALPAGYVRMLEEWNDNKLPNVSLSDALGVEVVRLTNTPKIVDPAQLREACSSDNAILFLISSVIDPYFGYSLEQALNVNRTLAEIGPVGKGAGWTQTTECDHLVYLVGGDDGCFLGPERNVFKIFTWGSPRYAKLDILMDGSDGMLCSATVSNVTTTRSPPFWALGNGTVVSPGDPLGAARGLASPGGSGIPSQPDKLSSGAQVWGGDFDGAIPYRCAPTRVRTARPRVRRTEVPADPRRRRRASGARAASSAPARVSTRCRPRRRAPSSRCRTAARTCSRRPRGSRARTPRTSSNHLSTSSSSAPASAAPRSSTARSAADPSASPPSSPRASRGRRPWPSSRRPPTSAAG